MYLIFYTKTKINLQIEVVHIHNSKNSIIVFLRIIN